MTEKINYKKQLEKLLEAVKGWRVDKVLGNTFTEYDKGHREATIKNSNDFVAVIEMALRGDPQSAYNSEEWREKRRAFLIGRHHSKETKLKMSLASKGNKRMLGKKHKEETKKRMSKTAKKNWQKEDYAKKMFKSFKISPNKPEKAMMQIIKENNLPFRWVGNGKVIFNGFNPDFLSKNPKHIIEVNGDYWHNLSKVRQRDRRKLKAFVSLGYKTLVVWEHELREPQKVAERVRRFMKC